MASIQPRPLPADAFLARYADRGGYVDCFTADVAGAVSLPMLVEAFYSSGVIKPELLTVGLLFARPASNARARQLAMGEIDRFSAWQVEDRDERQLLMRETISNKTRLWLKVEPLDEVSTRISFGTAVLPVGTRADGRPRMSLLFALIGFHKIYARALLAGAVRRLAVQASALRMASITGD